MKYPPLCLTRSQSLRCGVWRRSKPRVARVLMPNRAQMELRASDLESLLPEGHRARVVWAYVEQADLSRVYVGIKAVEGWSGRTPIAVRDSVRVVAIRHGGGGGQCAGDCAIDPGV